MSTELEPSLTAEDAVWAEEILRAARQP